MSATQAFRAVAGVVAVLTLATTAFADPRTDAPAVAVRTLPATPVAAAAPQPLICRSSVETGSLIQRHKQCLTKAQWRYVDDAHEDSARKLVTDQMTKPFCDSKC